MLLLGCGISLSAMAFTGGNVVTVTTEAEVVAAATLSFTATGVSLEFALKKLVELHSPALADDS